MAFIELKDVSKLYGNRLAVADFTLDIDEGERVVLLGPSGCGKTTVLRLMAGLMAPSSGSIRLYGELASADGKILMEPENRHIGMVFQDLALWPHLTVKGNLEFVLKAKGVPRSEREGRISEMLSLVSMEEFADVKPARLSGGQQQRVALARALISHPRILLMDEPLSNLDFELNLRLRREIIRLQNRIGFTLVYVTHDREEAYDIGTRIVIMRNGRIAMVGSADDAEAYFSQLYSEIENA